MILPLGSRLVSFPLAGAVTGGVVLLAASPYLAALTVSVPDRGVERWWRGGSASPARVGGCAVVAVVLGVLAGAAAGAGALLPPLLLLALAGAPLTVIDLEHHRLPDRLVFPLAVAAPILAVLAAAVRQDWYPLLRAVEAAAWSSPCCSC